MLREEAHKASANKELFAGFTQRFHKIYPNETEKEYRFEVYSENQLKIIEMNSAMIGIETNAVEAGRLLESAEITKEVIAVGNSWDEQ